MAMQDQRLQQSFCQGGRFEETPADHKATLYAGVVSDISRYPPSEEADFVRTRSACPQCDATFTRVCCFLIDLISVA